MVPVIKRKKVYVKKRKRKVLVCDRTEVKFNYMKYYRVVRYWAMRTYDITTPELEIGTTTYSPGTQGGYTNYKTRVLFTYGGQQVITRLDYMSLRTRQSV